MVSLDWVAVIDLRGVTERKAGGSLLFYHTLRATASLIDSKWYNIFMRKKFERKRAIAMYLRYQQLGTLKAVGEEFGVTGERVRQVLNRGMNLGAFKYDSRKPKIHGAKLLELVARKGFKWSKAAESLGLTKEKCEELALKQKKGRILMRYQNMVFKLGFEPNDGDLQLRYGARGLSSNILRTFGGFRAFCAEYGFNPHNERGFLNPETVRKALAARKASRQQAYP